MKSQSRVFKDPIYQVEVVAMRCLPKDIPKTVKGMKIVDGAKGAILTYFKGKGEMGGMAGHASRVTNEGSLEYTFVWLNPAAKSSTIAHEAFHITHSILSNAGMTLTDSAEEAYAYHLEWVIRELNHLWPSVMVTGRAKTGRKTRKRAKV